MSDSWREGRTKKEEQVSPPDFLREQQHPTPHQSSVEGERASPLLACLSLSQES